LRTTPESSDTQGGETEGGETEGGETADPSEPSALSQIPASARQRHGEAQTCYNLTWSQLPGVQVELIASHGLLHDCIRQITADTQGWRSLDENKVEKEVQVLMILQGHRDAAWGIQEVQDRHAEATR